MQLTALFDCCMIYLMIRHFMDDNLVAVMMLVDVGVWQYYLGLILKQMPELLA